MCKALNIRVDYGNMIRLNGYPVFIHRIHRTPAALVEKYTLTLNEVQTYIVMV